MARKRVYGWDAVRMEQNMTMQELVDLSDELMADPANKNPPGSFQIYNKKTQRKLKAISWAVYYKTGGCG